MAAQAAYEDKKYTNLIAGGALFGAQLYLVKYSRDAERESDLYGMRYMTNAGYDPAAAVDMQKVFLRWSEGKEEPSWLDGLFASHPPSAERIVANQRTLAELGNPGGEIGEDKLTQVMQTLKNDEPAYEAHEKALAATEAHQ
jgi:predicted Zn-dependent protease